MYDHGDIIFAILLGIGLGVLVSVVAAALASASDARRKEKRELRDKITKYEYEISDLRNDMKYVLETVRRIGQVPYDHRSNTVNQGTPEPTSPRPTKARKAR